MAETQNYDVEKGFVSHAEGIRTYHLDTWFDFVDFMNNRLEVFPDWIWRGHQSDKWVLEPTLDRLLKQVGKSINDDIRRKHLENFKYAARGRRGINPPPINNVYGWWALGQHHGLVTPLLDWTTSPYVAAYFAFCDEFNSNHNEHSQNYRAIIGLNKTKVEQTNKLVSEAYQKNIIGKSIDAVSFPSIISFVQPLSDDNARLVNQGGLFTLSNDGSNIESWVRFNTQADEGSASEDRHAYVVKLLIPEVERENCLRSLNRMNINHLSLFPDLQGASRHSNLNLMIDNY